MMRQDSPPQARRLTLPRRQAPAGANPPRQLPQAKLAFVSFTFSFYYC